MRSTPLADALLAAFDLALAGAADDEQARGMAAYMRQQFAFLGVTTPARVAISRAVVAEVPGASRPTAADLEAFARGCWAREEREHQYVGAWFLRRHARRLEPTSIDVLRDLLTSRSWWDTVDELAQNVVGPLVRAHPELAATMDAWIDDENIWLARTALLHQNRWKQATDADRLFAYCERRAADPEFFIRKAIGWALREYAKTDPDAVARFIDEHEDTLSGLSKREGRKWLDRTARR